MASPVRNTDTIDVERSRVIDLRQYLRKHGLPVSGSKYELKERVKGAFELKVKPLSDMKLRDANFSERRSVDLHVTPLGEDLPDVKTLKTGWNKDPNVLPPFTESDLYNYLVLNDTRTFDNKPINAKKQLKAKVFYTDRHLHSVEFHEINKTISHCYIRAKCIRSVPGMSTKENTFEYCVWLCLSKVSGRVHGAGCGCDAG